MAKYRLTKPHFIGTTYHEAGAVIETDKPGRHMVEVAKPAPKAEARPVTGPTPRSMDTKAPAKGKTE